MPTRSFFGDIKKWFVRTGKEAEDLVKDILTTAALGPVTAVILQYWQTLEIWAAGKWKPLPDEIITKLESHYRIDLRSILYVEGIGAGTHTAITFGPHIFFPRDVDFSTPGDLHWLCHELTHCQQYAESGGVAIFLHRYVGQVADKVLATRTFQVHDLVKLEIEAEQWADAVARSVGSGQLGARFKISGGWPTLAEEFHGGLDAVLNGAGPVAGKHYLFKGAKYARYDWAKDRMDDGYPNAIASGWRGIPDGFKEGVDAAICGRGKFAGKCYFFKGNLYIRYDWAEDRMDPGYPQEISSGWPGLPDSFQAGFDALINLGDKCYIFRGDEYVRWDWEKDSMDEGYPFKIGHGWHGLPPDFAGDFDATVEGDGPYSGKGYLFKGDSYIRYDWASDRADTF